MGRDVGGTCNDVKCVLLKSGIIVLMINQGSHHRFDIENSATQHLQHHNRLVPLQLTPHLRFKSSWSLTKSNYIN